MNTPTLFEDIDLVESTDVIILNTIINSKAGSTFLA